jgi:hypothetical protein
MRNLVIIPTRNRGIEIRERVLESASKSEMSEFILSVDDDDDTDYSWVERVGLKLAKNPNKSMNDALNAVAIKYSSKFEYLTFMGDDHVARTQSWDTRLVESISRLSFGLAYGDDLIAGEKLPTSIVLSSSLVETLGYMTPQCLRHMYLDNFWLDIGTQTNRIHFVPSVIIEHMHHSVGKSQLDMTYKATNRHRTNLSDRLRYATYRTFSMPRDIFKLSQLD